METIQKGKQTNKQATCALMTKVNKQTNKQAEVACAEAWCRRENGSMHIPPMETRFGCQDTSQSSQVKNPIMGRIVDGNPSICFLKCYPNRDAISS